VWAPDSMSRSGGSSPVSVGAEDQPFGERLLGGGDAMDDYGGRRPRGCLGRLGPLLCRCLGRLRRPGVSDEVREYGKLERDTRNPLAADGASETLVDGPGEVEVTERSRPEGLGADDPYGFEAGAREAPGRRDAPDAEAEAFGRAEPAAPPPPRAAAAAAAPPPPPADDGAPVEDDDDETEPEEDYCPGGYHPVALGDVYDDRYEVLHKLGWGVYSTVWCCYDAVGRRKVALKIQKAAPEYTNAAVNEIELLRDVRDRAAAAGRDSGVVELLEHFYVAGPHGNHVCMVFELLGKTLLHAIQERGALPPAEVRAVAARLLECLAFVHDDVGALHTDIKPENVLLEPEAPGGAARCAVKLVDLGTAFYVDRQAARDIQTREYRCPEGILGIWPFGPAADVWSVGCLVFELLTGETLFDPQSPRAGEAFTKDESHLAQAVELLGPVPPALASRGHRSAKWFLGDASTLKNIAIAPPPRGVDAIARVLEENFGFDRGDAGDASTFLRALLAYDPADRVTAKQALGLPWLRGAAQDDVAL